MPFDPDSSSPSNPYKKGEKAGLALARFLQVLANFFKLNAQISGDRDTKITAEAFGSR